MLQVSSKRNPLLCSTCRITGDWQIPTAVKAEVIALQIWNENPLSSFVSVEEVPELGEGESKIESRF